MVATPLPFTRPQLRQSFMTELTGNILPFWIGHAIDPINSGFYGAVTNDLIIHNEVPRSAILCSRILWAYASAYRRFGDAQYLSMAQQAYRYLTQIFWDPEYGGVYWQVDCQGKAVRDHKHHYAQAFAIYGLSEYHRATGDTQSLVLAQSLFGLLEEHAYEPVYRGYLEGSNRTWGTLTDTRLSLQEPNSHKSMNTMLHILEAYTNLLRVWPDTHLKARHQELIEVFLQHIVDPLTHHFKLFFDDKWHSLTDTQSFGHDIEGSWLLCEAAEMQADTALLARVHDCAISMALVVHREGLDDDGSLLYEAGPEGVRDATKAWWAQAEAVVGFYNAYQLSGAEYFAVAAYGCWRYIQSKVVDREHGDWIKQLYRDGTPDHTIYKIGPWECPYHHSRVCLEMLERLDD
jgi:mannobiose 2-epimerase